MVRSAAQRSVSNHARALAAAFSLLLATAAHAAPRVVSLDQCADQYVLALSPREAIAALSPRARDRDSYLRDAARGLPMRRASTEAVLAARPQVVVRYWGGDDRLARELERRGVRVVKIGEADTFDAVRTSVRQVAAALSQPAKGEALVARMDADLAAGNGAWRGASALYLTPSGFTAGPGTLIDAMLRAAGLKDETARPGYQFVSLEHLVAQPPAGLVLGFFDAVGVSEVRWGGGRHRVLRTMAAEKAIARLPASILGCPAWFASDGVRALGAAKRGA